jgi:predicted N-acyltransferase
VILILAYQGDDCLAGALLYRSDSVLYGRHWGCRSEFDSLHFETCFYQGIEYAISQGLRSFEPGAQGEHKIWRGFLPTLTRSHHWIADLRYRVAIDDFLNKEGPAIEHYRSNLAASSPYRQVE